jgi:hypothetical protein
VETANASVPEVGSEATSEPSGNARLKQGDTIGSRFVVDERLRDDALGTVYRAVDDRSGKKIAILMVAAELAGEAAATERLRKSVKSATELAHKNIVAVYGMGKEGRRRYLAREYVDGQTLAELLDKKAEAGKTFTLKGAYNLVAHVCNALQYARATMPHGTLRPSCVFINRTGRVKVADFGLAELRPALLERRAELSRWDAPCFPPRPEGAPPEGEGAGAADDLQALGVILFELLAGAPPAELPAVLPPAVSSRLPPQLADILRRAFAADEAERLRDPNELKTELLQVIESARGAGRSDVDERDETPAASVEQVEDATPAPATPVAPIAPPGKAAPRKPQAPARKRGDDGGFVIPELKPAGQTDDDGTAQRWLVEKDGVDFGPYTSQQVIEQLFKQELKAETTLYDIEQDRRAPLSEFTVFDEALVAWAHDNAERQKRQAEEAAQAAARRRRRLVWGSTLAIVLTVGGVGGGYAWYRATRPEPVKAYLPALVTKLQGALPAVHLPEELPETAAEKDEKRRTAAAVAAQQRARVEAQREAAQVADEARQASQSTVDLNSNGAGRSFDRQAFDDAVARRNGQLMRCLQDEVRRDPSLKSLEVKITVVPRGDLINVRLSDGSPAGNSCVREALGGLKVPPFDGVNLNVSLPFTFQK